MDSLARGTQRGGQNRRGHRHPLRHRAPARCRARLAERRLVGCGPSGLTCERQPKSTAGCQSRQIWDESVRGAIPYVRSATAGHRDVPHTHRPNAVESARQPGDWHVVNKVPKPFRRHFLGPVRRDQRLVVFDSTAKDTAHVKHVNDSVRRIARASRCHERSSPDSGDVLEDAQRADVFPVEPDVAQEDPVRMTTLQPTDYLGCDRSQRTISIAGFDVPQHWNTGCGQGSHRSPETKLLHVAVITWHSHYHERRKLQELTRGNGVANWTTRHDPRNHEAKLFARHGRRRPLPNRVSRSETAARPDRHLTHRLRRASQAPRRAE